MSSVGRILSLAVVLSALASSAQGQATRTWVSGVGDDINPCSRTAPCKTFAGALPKTAMGGEISVLDPGGYGTVVINKSVTISGDGTLASIIFGGGANGIVVNITNPQDIFKKVIIRDVSLNGATNLDTGQPTGINGIRFLAGKEVKLEKVTIYGCTTNGVDVALGTNAAGTLYVRDSTIANCATGIRATANSGFAEVILDNVLVSGTTNEVELAANGRIIARDSTFAGTGLNQNGVLLNAATAQASLERCTITFNNANGVSAAVAGAVARVASSAFLNNSTGVTNVPGAQTLSDGRNVFAGNGADGVFTGSLLVQ
jgi:hypothetical protein